MDASRQIIFSAKNSQRETNDPRLFCLVISLPKTYSKKKKEKKNIFKN